MGWDDVVRIIVAAIFALGGGGAIVARIVKYCADRITERLSAKYELKLNKELENFKSRLENKNYVSRVRFDAEFEIFRKLTSCFYELVKCTDAFVNLPQLPDDKMQESIKQQAWYNCKSAIEKAQDLFFANNTFIPEDIDKQLENLFILCRNQFVPISQGEEQKSVYEEWTAIRSNIRKYLKSLEVMEENK